MAPGVSVRFTQNGLGISPLGNTDSVFACIGPCSLGQPDSVVTVVDPNTILSTLGTGPLAELTAAVRKVLDRQG